MGIHWYLSATFVYGFQALFVPLLTEFGWGRGVGSLAASIQSVLSGSLSPLTGYLTDKFGVRRVVVVSVIFTGLGMVSIGFIQALWMYYLSFALISVGFASMFIPFSAAIVNWFHRLRGRALGIGYSGAVASGPFVVLMVLLVEAVGWRQTAVLTGAGMLLLGIPLALLIRSRPADLGLHPDGDAARVSTATEPLPQSAAVPEVSARRALRDANFWLMAAIFGLLHLGISSLMLHQIPYFVSIGFSPAQAASSVAYFTVLSLFGRVATGWLMDVMDRRLVLAGLLVCQTLAFVVLLNVTAQWHMAVFGFLLGTAFGGMIPAQPLIGTALFGLASFGTIQGILGLTMTPFSMAAPLLLGIVFDQTGSYAGGLWLYAALSLAGAPLAFLLRLPKRASSAR